MVCGCYVESKLKVHQLQLPQDWRKAFVLHQPLPLLAERCASLNHARATSARTPSVTAWASLKDAAALIVDIARIHRRDSTIPQQDSHAHGADLRHGVYAFVIERALKVRQLQLPQDWRKASILHQPLPLLAERCASLNHARAISARTPSVTAWASLKDAAALIVDVTCVHLRESTLPQQDAHAHGADLGHGAYAVQAPASPGKSGKSPEESGRVRKKSGMAPGSGGLPNGTKSGKVRKRPEKSGMALGLSASTGTAGESPESRTGKSGKVRKSPEEVRKSPGKSGKVRKGPEKSGGNPGKCTSFSFRRTGERLSAFISCSLCRFSPSDVLRGLPSRILQHSS
eukprot:gene12312-biopygen1770